MLSIRGVSLQLGGKTIVHDASLDVADGEIVGLLGPNGSGKSTLLRSVFKVLKPTQGKVLLLGHDVWTQSTAWVGRHTGVVLQDGPMDFPLSVNDVVMQGRTARKALFEPDNTDDREVTAAALETIGMSTLAHRPFRELSGGERQRVLIAQALACQPDLFVMDEPLNHLDLRHQHDLMRILTRLGTSTLIAMHDLDMAARYCDRIIVMSQGKVLASGSPADVLTAELISEIYEVPVILTRNPTDDTPVVIVI
ncbi:ABC transporter ATP-binding protein [Propionibacterium freudenreichii]|uniref:ABC transporter ATP-binding protein n=1 Tax=Propionibacterium freudenreichii TaxID=1744 RepID=UPI0005427F56|nr:ABC transporter ATP-binding protein [Propionibacterium freudenreichii]MDK9592773.1 ABC transporter ATP-binding protein [Propionibacterium freudenreichii]MDK9643569.1 ABC transporter ATP-binding protein [Propionibacterium freudenreichii]WFF31343.1 ABC transporter ATP-binding protein [Propionibacterium freudenreichii]WFF33606.1 ABC transporter ATP-binding protein [Propionibacterium freudenreichii]WFF35837.1 ABC transporter ATP-binding protein [Propionibacterium freudenreichii]